jgi:hypothetical protein
VCLACGIDVYYATLLKITVHKRAVKRAFSLDDSTDGTLPSGVIDRLFVAAVHGWLPAEVWRNVRT